MASTEEEINSLIRTKSYTSKDEVISDALRALLVEKPALKIEMAVDLYETGRASLGKAADIAGMSREEFKELLASRSIRVEVGESKKERMKALDKYVGIIKLKKPLTLEEILELEEDTWLS